MAWEVSRIKDIWRLGWWDNKQMLDVVPFVPSEIVEEGQVETNEDIG
jgi:hypothetical protein